MHDTAPITTAKPTHLPSNRRQVDRQQFNERQCCDDVISTSRDVCPSCQTPLSICRHASVQWQFFYRIFLRSYLPLSLFRDDTLASFSGKIRKPSGKNLETCPPQRLQPSDRHKSRILIEKVFVVSLRNPSGKKVLQSDRADSVARFEERGPSLRAHFSLCQWHTARERARRNACVSDSRK